jgi:hypothetical protein
MTPDEAALPLCPICGKPVSLETAKADSLGRAIHGDCYLLALHQRGSEDFPRTPC